VPGDNLIVTDVSAQRSRYLAVAFAPANHRRGALFRVRREFDTLSAPDAGPVWIALMRIASRSSGVYMIEPAVSPADDCVRAMCECTSVPG
jgi:hypothetical protein